MVSSSVDTFLFCGKGYKWDEQYGRVILNESA